MRCSWHPRSVLCRRCLIRGTEYWICCRWKLRHGWCDLRFLLPFWTTDMWRIRVQILRGSSGLRCGIEGLSTPTRSFEIVICMAVFLLVPGLPCWVNAQSDCSHLRRKSVYVLFTRVHSLSWLWRLWWEIAFLLHWGTAIL